MRMEAMLASGGVCLVIYRPWLAILWCVGPKDWPTARNRMDKGSTRWSKGSLGFRVRPRVKDQPFNFATQLFMRVQAPPSRCRSDSVAPRPATGSQRSGAGLNGGTWKPHSGYPVSQASMGSESEGVVEPS